MTRATVWSRLKAASDRTFVERELWLRSQDRVRYVRITPRLQKLVAGGMMLTLGWGLFASTAWLVRGYQIEARDGTIETQKLAYFDLLTEVSEYHSQFSAITQDMEENQAFLLSLLEQDQTTAPAIAAIEDQLKSSETERARVAVARDSLRIRLDEFEGELQNIAARNSTLQDKVTHLKDTLQATEAERLEVTEAREQLGHRLQLTEVALSETMKSKDELLAQVGALQTTLAETEATRDSLEMTKRDLSDRIVSLESSLSQAMSRQAALEQQIGSLETALSEQVAANTGLTGERSQLQNQVASLQGLLGELQDKQQDLVERMTVRSDSSIEELEAKVASTGLDVDQLLGQVEGYPAGQGGPFIPADDLLEADGAYELQVSVAMLDLQLERWEALQQILQALPVAVPIEKVDITSTFGYRSDPINGRKAMHTGIDFGGSVDTPLYSTGDGVVIFAGWRGRYGRVVEIDHGFGIVTRYAHMRSISVKKGDEIALGDEVGTLGASGRVTGPHLHYEILFNGEPYDPMNFIKAGRDVF